MLDEDMKTEHTVLVSLARNCAKTKDLHRGCKVHADLLKKGLPEQSPYVVDALVNMYAKCGALAKAKDLLLEFHVRDVFSWTALISGYVQQGQSKLALICFEWMQHEGLSPDAVTFACMLRACGSLRAIDEGSKIHDVVAQQGLLDDDLVLGNALVDMYAKCGALAKAAQVLEELPDRDVVTWNALIAGYTQHGQAEDALKCIDLMQHEGLAPDRVTFTCALKACGSLGAAAKGQRFHDKISKEGLLAKDNALGNALVDMYAKCGALKKAQQVLNELSTQDVISWNALIAGYAQQCQGEEALNCFEQMQKRGISPDALTFTFVLKACGTVGASCKGEQIHDEITRQGLLREDIILGNALVDMYAKCGAIGKAQKVLEELHVRNTVSWNTLIAGYVQQGHGHDALKCFEQMQREGFSPDAITLACILKACSSIEAVDKGRQIHDKIVSQGLLENNVVLGNALLDMYVKCGALSKAQQVLEELPVQSVVSWNIILAGYAHQSQGGEALNCLERMQCMGFVPDSVTFACALKACGSIGAIEKGEEIHENISKQGLLADHLVLGNALVDMYAKCGAFAKALEVLEKLPVRDAISWNALITAYVQHGQAHEALNCLDLMQLEGLSSNAVTYACILKACGSLGALDKGEQIHLEISRQGLFEKDTILSNALIDMYVKCGALAKAQKVLKELRMQNVTAWNALIAGFVQQGQGQDAIECFEQMQHEGFCPDAVTYASILKACGCMKAAGQGKQIHVEIARRDLLGEDFVLNSALVEMYCKCGALSTALEVMEELAVVDVASWNALISGYIQQDEGEMALACFEGMQCEGLSPDAVTFACILKACGNTGEIDKGEHIHDQIIGQGILEKDVVLGNALVAMYVKCGALAKARKVLEELCVQNVVSWNALIAGYAQQGKGHNALDCFEQMRHKGLSADAVTFTCVLKACGSIGAADKGEQIHDEIVKEGLLETNVVLGNALVDMYTKLGDLKKAQHVLEELPARNVVTWNTLIAGYASQGQGQNALTCFERMKGEGSSPDVATFLCILKACRSIGAVDKGEEIHIEIARQGLLNKELVLGNALVDMYAKCGALTKAYLVLLELPVQDVVSWNTLMAGYADQGSSQDALNCLLQMRNKSVSPDAFTFSCVLNACSHSGRIDEGEMCFADMTKNYETRPTIEHYICMVDLFGRVGHLDKAVALIKKTQSFDHPVIWSTLLSACQRWGDVNIARWAFQNAVKVDTKDAGPYILMANIYADAGMQGNADNINAAMSRLLYERR